MAVTYGTDTLPNALVTLREQTSTAVSLAFDNAVGIIGGYDASAGSIGASDENTNIEINGTDEARDKFGENSELYKQVQLAFANGAGRIVCTPVAESSTTESVTGSSSITLSNPAIDPRTNPEESITATDTTGGTDLTVNVVDGTPSTPSSSDTLNINPYTGEGEFDNSSDYDVTYTEGDYAGASSAAKDADVRFVALCSADTGVITSVLADINDAAQAFDFKRLVAPVETSVTPSSYSVPSEDNRLIMCAPTYGTALDTTALLSPSVAAQMASQPLGTSATGNGLNGYDSLVRDFSISETTDFGPDSDVGQVTVVRNSTLGTKIVEDLTTHTGEKFEDVYKMEIVDDIAYSLHVVGAQFINGPSPNTPSGRRLGLETPTRSVCRDAASNSPPLLASTDGSRPYTVSSSAGSNDEEANLTVGIDVVGIPKTVDVSIGVGAVQTFEGAS